MIKSANSSLDYGILIPTFILVIFGLSSLYFINTAYFRSQLLFYIVSLLIYFLIARSNIFAFKSYVFPIYIISLIFLFIVLILGIESRGAIRWISILGINVQMSEVLKPFLGICLATFLAKWKDRSFFSFVLVILMLLPLLILIGLQPDLGSALIYVFTVLFVLLTFGYPLWWFGVGLLSQFVVFPLFLQLLHPYQKQRLLTFLHPSNDPLGSSYNAIQSIIAVGSGSLFGKGLGEGTQSVLKFLPERHTDFIFATLTEGLGFIGAIILLIVFAFLLLRIYKIFQREDEGFSKNFA